MEEWLSEIHNWCLANKQLIIGCYKSSKGYWVGHTFFPQGSTITVFCYGRLSDSKIYDNGIRESLTSICEKYKFKHICTFEKKYIPEDAIVIYDDRIREHLEKLEQSGNNDC